MNFVEKLTYNNFKIGQTVICTKIDDYMEQHLTVGKKYIIEDLDFHFPDAICVRSDNKKISMFINISYFSDNKIIRKMKLEKLEKIKNEEKNSNLSFWLFKNV